MDTAARSPGAGHTCIASRASRTIWARRFAVLAAARSSLALSSPGNRTVTDGEWGARGAQRRPSHDMGLGGCLDELIRDLIRQASPGVGTHVFGFEINIGPDGPDGCVEGDLGCCSHISAASQCDGHDMVDYETLRCFDGDNFEFEVSAVNSDVEPSLVAAFGDG